MAISKVAMATDLTPVAGLPGGALAGLSVVKPYAGNRRLVGLSGIANATIAQRDGRCGWWLVSNLSPAGAVVALVLALVGRQRARMTTRAA